MITKFAKIATLFVVFLIIAGASAYLTLTFIIKSEDTVIVPDLVGKDVVTALERLTDLKVRKIKLAIDDFGTGYSSLLYLKHFPFDRIKVAKRLVDNSSSTSAMSQYDFWPWSD